MKFLKNNLVLIAFAALAVSGIAFLVWAAGANVNCVKGVCYSTNGRSTTDYDPNTPGDQAGENDADITKGVFTGENDTASIECRTVNTDTSTTDSDFKSGGGNDTLYLVNPQDGTTPTAITVSGEDGDDVIIDGCSSDNTLSGGNGNDVLIEDAVGTLNGNDGNDLLAGGQGNDTFEVNTTNPADETNAGNDIYIGGPGADTYNTGYGSPSGNDGDDIVIIHKGDVNSIESYTCYGNDIIMLFGFNLDLVLELLSSTPSRIYGFAENVKLSDVGLGNAGQVAIADPVNNATGTSTGSQYQFTASSNSKCTIISVD